MVRTPLCYHLLQTTIDWIYSSACRPSLFDGKFYFLTDPIICIYSKFINEEVLCCGIHLPLYLFWIKHECITYTFYFSASLSFIGSFYFYWFSFDFHFLNKFLLEEFFIKKWNSADFLFCYYCYTSSPPLGKTSMISYLTHIRQVHHKIHTRYNHIFPHHIHYDNYESILRMPF